MLLPSSLKAGFDTLTKKQEGKERLIGGLNTKKIHFSRTTLPKVFLIHSIASFR